MRSPTRIQPGQGPQGRDSCTLGVSVGQRRPRRAAIRPHDPTAVRPLRVARVAPSVLRLPSGSSPGTGADQTRALVERTLEPGVGSPPCLLELVGKSSVTSRSEHHQEPGGRIGDVGPQRQHLEREHEGDAAEQRREPAWVAGSTGVEDAYAHPSGTSRSSIARPRRRLPARSCRTRARPSAARVGWSSSIEPPPTAP